MFRPVLAVFLVALGIASLFAREQEDTPAKELVQYVRDARKAGLTDGQIRQDAAKAGWPVTAVADAIAYVEESNPPSKQPANGQPAPTAKDAPAAAGQTAVPAASTAGPQATGTSPANPGDGAPVEKPLVVSRGVPDDYQIGAGDVLHISVWKEPEASVPSVVVRPDGKISMPLLKEISVVGLTPSQAEKIITEQLSKFITAADVTVVVSGINSKKIYITGAVRKEGPIAYTYRMTIMQAISEAGGLNDYAKRKKIYVLRNEDGREFRLHFDYDAVLKGEHMELNIPLQPGDTLVVPH
jgi:polysaccharide export outer membrane protein